MSSTTPTTAPGRRLRLLQVLGYAGGGGERFGITGVERVVEILLEGLDASGFEHFLAYPRAGELFERYQKRARVVALEPRRRWDPAYVAGLADLIRAQRIDLVLSHGLRFDFHAAMACRRTHVPHLVVRAVAFADEAMPTWQHRLYGLADAWTLGACRGIIAVSEASKRRMLTTQRQAEAKITVIPNGVSVPRVDPEAAASARRELGVADDALLVGGVGQLIPRKAFEVLVEALGTLRGRLPNVTCVLVGEGPERGHLEELARTRGVSLILPGYRPDPYPAMAGFDVAVLPSRAEGMPLVVLEAMGLGVACVATPAAGTAELIEDGKSGLLVPPDDAPALARALARVLEDAPLRSRLAAAGCERVRAHYSLEAMLAGFDRTLRHAAGWMS